MPQRLGVLGGTFDPVHVGHLRVAEEACEGLSLDRVLFIPSADPPHKAGDGILPFENRAEMLRIAVDGNPRFEVSDVESRMSGRSYSVLTMERLRIENPPGTEFFFLLGLDAFLELDTWWHFKDLLFLARLVVLGRPGFDQEHIESFLIRKVSPLFSRLQGEMVFRHPEMFPVYCPKSTRLEISSTRIRQLVAEGKSIRYLVLPEVMRYIEQHGLYRAVLPIDE